METKEQDSTEVYRRPESSNDNYQETAIMKTQ